MPGGVLSANGVVEYVAESTFGTFPTNPTMKWAGIVEEFTWKIKVVEEAIRGLRSSSSTKRNLPTLKTKVGEEALDVSMTYAMQDFDLFKYSFSSTGGDSQTNDLASLSFGIIEPSTPKYGKIVGNVIKSAKIECEVNKAARVSIDTIAADIVRSSDDPWSSSDYVGSGSHASEDTSTPFRFSDIQSVTYNGSSLKDSLNKITITVENDLSVIYGLDSSLNTKVDSIVAGQRNIQVELNVDMDGLDFDSDVLGATNANLVLTWDSGDTITVYGVTFPELEKKFAQGDHLAATIKSENCTDLQTGAP